MARETAVLSQRAESLYYGYPDGMNPSFLRVAPRADDNQLTAVSTVKAYDGPVFSLDGTGCVPHVSDRQLLTLDRRVEAGALPEVFETAL